MNKQDDIAEERRVETEVVVTRFACRNSRDEYRHGRYTDFSSHKQPDKHSQLAPLFSETNRPQLILRKDVSPPPHTSVDKVKLKIQPYRK